MRLLGGTGQHTFPSENRKQGIAEGAVCRHGGIDVTAVGAAGREHCRHCTRGSARHEIRLGFAAGKGVFGKKSQAAAVGASVCEKSFPQADFA